MNKKFMKPEIEVIKYEVSDVIATSGFLSMLFGGGFDIGSTDATSVDSETSWD